MKTNRILLGGLAGGVTFFFLGWLVYGILLKNYAAANYNQCSNRAMEDMIWWAMIISNLAIGFLLSSIFSWSNTTGLLAGAKIAGIIGVLLAVSIDLSFYAMTTMFSNAAAVFVDIIANTGMTAVTGAIVASVMGLVKK